MKKRILVCVCEFAHCVLCLLACVEGAADSCHCAYMWAHLCILCMHMCMCVCAFFFFKVAEHNAAPVESR